MDIHSLLEGVLSNQFATGLGATAILGGALYQLRSLPSKLWKLFLFMFTVKLTVYSEDESYEWIDKWLSKQPYSKNTTRVLLRSYPMNDGSIVDDGSRTNFDEWALTPGAGSHWFVWKHRILYFERDVETDSKTTTGAVSTGRKRRETLSFRILGRKQEILRNLVRESLEIANKSTLVPLKMWRSDWWKSIKGKSLRSMDTIILKDNQTERIIEDIQNFLASAEWYAYRGIPYRRGYLFYGPPGTGKTSIVLGLAGYLNRPVCILNLGSIQSDDSLFEAVTEAPVNSIILIEDIDCAIPAADRKAEEGEKVGKEGEKSLVTRAGLYNALDGISTPDGRIFIMTTNYPERLDEALKRRAEVQEYFGFFGAEEQRKMAERFYPGEEFEALQIPISPAKMQAAFTMYPNDMKAARERLCEVYEKELSGMPV